MITQDIIKETGRFIRLGGHGILDGLKQPRNKRSFYLIKGIDEQGLILKGYRARYSVRLPETAWNQDYEIVDSIKQYPEF